VNDCDLKNFAKDPDLAASLVENEITEVKEDVEGQKSSDVNRGNSSDKFQGLTKFDNNFAGNFSEKNQDPKKKPSKKPSNISGVNKKLPKKVNIKCKIPDQEFTKFARNKFNFMKSSQKSVIKGKKEPIPTNFTGGKTHYQSATGNNLPTSTTSVNSNAKLIKLNQPSYKTGLEFGYKSSEGLNQNTHYKPNEDYSPSTQNFTSKNFEGNPNTYSFQGRVHTNPDHHGNGPGPLLKQNSSILKTEKAIGQPPNTFQESTQNEMLMFFKQQVNPQNLTQNSTQKVERDLLINTQDLFETGN
jgi:hypothetical protein